MDLPVLGVQSELNDALQRQVNEIDLDALKKLASGEQKSVDWASLAAKAVPPAAFRVDDADAKIAKADAIDAGRQLLVQGKVAMILVAGGQGTRLGFDHPKGMYPIGPVSDRTLFQIMIDRVKALSTKYNQTIPVYVMTSPATDAETRKEFEKQDWYGCSRNDLKIFCQGTMPAVDKESGKLLRASENELALSPNGHGGMLDALVGSNCFDDASKLGVEHFFYGQIDNPLVQICDEELLGYHLLAGSEMTTQVVQKAHALEKVGNVVEIDGKVQIIEYIDLPDEFAKKSDDQGGLLLWAGNIAVHVFQTNFLKRAADSDLSLPFHIANKKVPFLNDQGELVEPDSPNALKFEKFIFDLLPMAKNAIAVEVKKSEGFAPVKNADGADSDTPELAKQAISDLHKLWLRNCGVQIADQTRVEIHPAFALNEADLVKKDLPAEINSNTFLTP